MIAAVERALAILARRRPAAAARAARALEALVPPCCEAEAAWSTLTADGCPVELTFSSLRHDVRYTIEVQCPGADPARGLAAARRGLDAVGASPLPPWLAGRLEAIQRRGRRLTYGAWLGGGHGDDGDRYKLYAEVPCPAPDSAAALVHDVAGGAGVYGRYPLRMVGHDPEAAVTELYFRAGRLAPPALRALADDGGHDPDAIGALLAELTGDAGDGGDGPGRGAPLPGSWGFSVAVAATGALRAITLFTFARGLIGADAAVRRRLRAVARRRGWDLDDYADVTRPLARPDGRPGRHGMLALVLRAGHPIEVRIGTSPPPAPSAAAEAA